MNPTHLFLLTAISCLIFNLAKAQSPRHFIKWADESYADGDYYGAGVYYEKAMAKDSLDIQLLWKYANALRLSNQYAKAAWYYAKIYKKERGTLFPESAFWLAVMQKNTGHYRGAIKTWKKLERKYKRKKSSYYYRKAHQERASCTWANEHLTDSVPVTVRNIGKPVNSYMAEFGAYLKDSTLYFSTLRAKKYGDNREVYDTRYTTQIFQSEKKGGLYAPPKAIDTTINPTGMHVANGVFNAAGTGFYFSRCPDLKTCGIWMSKWQNGRWGQAIELEGINKPGTMTTQPMMARVNDKEYLFFASDRDGGEGKMDIWYALAKGNNQFGKPRNAGKTINSPDDEITPWYNNGKLYFSSRWHYGYGGFDIFRSDGVPGNFAPPYNMSRPFNSPANDYYFSIDSTGLQGFLSSNRMGSLYKKSPTCCNDIYTFQFPAEPSHTPAESQHTEIQTLDDLNRYLPVQLYFHNDEPDPRTTTSTTKSNYIDVWQAYLMLRKDYLKAYAGGLRAEDSATAVAQMNDFFENRVIQGVTDLKLFSDLLLEELEKGRNIEITLQGFASPLARTDYNVKLTGRRISSLENFFSDYRSGGFLPYIRGDAPNGGSLTFVRIPFGEYTADTLVSSNPEEKERSIYSRSAALERRIRIVSVQQANRDSSYAEMSFFSEIHDFGACFSGDTLHTTFTLKNTGNKPLIIDSVLSECSCLKITPMQTEIAPGASSVFQTILIAAQEPGLRAYYFHVFSNGIPDQKRLSVTAEIFQKE